VALEVVVEVEAEVAEAEAAATLLVSLLVLALVPGHSPLDDMRPLLLLPVAAAVACLLLQLPLRSLQRPLPSLLRKRQQQQQPLRLCRLHLLLRRLLLPRALRALRPLRPPLPPMKQRERGPRRLCRSSRRWAT